MTLREFLSKLPPLVMAKLEAYDFKAAIAALPDPLFEELTRAVIARFQTAEGQSPNPEEIALWQGGNRIGAIQMLRARTGQSLVVCKQLLERGLLTNMAHHIFLSPDDKEPPKE